MHHKKITRMENCIQIICVLFRCLAPHTDCTLQNLESKTKELFLCYCKFALVDPSTFQGITLYDLI